MLNTKENKENIKNNIWLAIIGSKKFYTELNEKTESWWCLPNETQEGDYVFFYCTASVSKLNQGIFSLYKVISSEKENSSECSFFGGTNSIKLFKFKLIFVKKYNKELKLSVIKKNVSLSDESFVKRNCQGTYFKINEKKVKIIIDLLDNL